MSDEAKLKEPIEPLTGRGFFRTVVCVIAANVFKELGWLPLFVGFLVASAIVWIIVYWIPPKPPVSFSVWCGKVATVFVLMLLGLWAFPKLISHWVWSPLAYGALAFITLTLAYWIPGLYPAKEKAALWKWIAFSLAFGLFFGLIRFLPNS